MVPRRQVIAGGVALLGSGGAYAVSSWRHSPTIPDGLYVDGLSHRGRAFDGEPREMTAPRESATVVVEGESAARYLFVADGPVGAFVDDVDFETSYLVVLEHARSSRWELVLDSLERGATELSVSVLAHNWPPGQVDDLALHYLLLGIVDDSTPDAVSVDVTEREAPLLRSATDGDDNGHGVSCCRIARYSVNLSSEVRWAFLVVRLQSVCMSLTATETGPASAQWLHGLWEYYREYTHTAIHTASAAALTTFGLLVFLDRLFVVLAIVSYLGPPIVLYSIGADAGKTSDSSENTASRADLRENSDADADTDSDSDDGDSDSDSDDGDSDSDSEDGDADSDGADADADADGVDADADADG